MLKTILTLGIPLLTYYVINSIIPVDVFNQSPMIITAIAATLIAAPLGYFAYSTTKPKDSAHHPQEYLIIIGSIILWVVLIIWLYTAFENKVNTRLQANSVMTVGTVVSCKQNLSKRRSNATYTSVLSYQTTSGQSYTTQHVDSACYKTGSTFRVAYSKPNPAIAKVIDSPEDMDAITGIKTQDITAKSLIDMLDLDLEALGVRLNEMSFEWVLDAENTAWINNGKGLIVGQRDGTIYYRFKGYKQTGLAREFVALGFTKEVSEDQPEASSGKPVNAIFVSDTHRALLSRTINKVKTKSGPAPMTLDIETMVVVTKK